MASHELPLDAGHETSVDSLIQNVNHPSQGVVSTLFSIALLVFEDGSREAYHEHAFNCVSWVLSGHLSENFMDGKGRPLVPSWRPFITRRSNSGTPSIRFSSRSGRPGARAAAGCCCG